MKSLPGKRALVTGAASGIGRAIALALARRGVRLFLLDIDSVGLADVACQAREIGVEVIAEACNLADREAVSTSVQSLLRQWGTLDILVNNAGVAYDGPTERMTAEQWDWLLGINLHAPIQLTRELLPMLLAQPGSHILNVCSIAGLVAGRHLAAYHVSKFGLVGFSESLRAEYGRRGLGVTALCPGLVQTNLFQAAASGRSKGRRVPPSWLCASPDNIAARAIRAIRRNEGLVVVTGMARALWLCKRLSPRLLAAVQSFRRKRRAA